MGAGVAGLIAATRLASNKGLRVVVVESGLRQFDAALDALNEIDNPASNYPARLPRRFRGLGGTSLLWAGKLLPLTRSDALPRPYLDLEGWPFDVAELDRYTRDIESLMGVDHESYEEDASSHLDPDSLLSRNDQDFVLRWPKRPMLENHNLAHVLRHEIEKLDNLEIWLGATVARFEADSASGKIASLRATNHAGQTLNVAATQYLIAAGALESTRLLLLADRQLNRPISRDGDVLGRYFNDHLGLKVATLRPIDWGATNRALSDRSRLSAARHLHFELRPEVQRAHGTGSAYFDVGAVLPASSALPKIRAILNSIRSGAPRLSLGDLRDVVQDLPSLLWHTQWQLMRRQKYWPRQTDLQVMVWVEQLPHWQNRVCLSDQIDGLQMPRTRLEWTKTDVEEKTFRIMVEKVDTYWRRHLASFCELEWSSAVLRPDGRLADAAEDLAHPAGSTRMGTTPFNSVIDSNLVVHRIPNLAVVSSSVFPTSGSANPTLTVMQLAMRAADALARRLAC